MDNTVVKGLEYAAFNRHIFNLIPNHISTLLDVGCGTGELGKAIRDKHPNIKMAGITFSAEEAKLASSVYNQVFIHDINSLSIEIDNNWDCIIFSHVLEHTYHPEIILRHYAELLSKRGIILIGLPNVMFFKQRLQFLKGNFRYSDKGGLMDNTHFRFFDFVSARELVKNSGLEILTAEGQGKFPLGPIRSWFPQLANNVDRKIVGWLPGLFSFQFLIVAKNKKD